MQVRAIFILCLLFGSVCYADMLQERPIQVCFNSESEFPPYSYFPRNVDGKIIPGRVVGASVDLMQEVFSQLDLKYEIKLLPWTRVVNSLSNYFSDSLCEIAWDMSINDERIEHIYFSKPLYRIQMGFYYSKKIHPNPFSLSKIIDLFGYSLCGVRGYDYAPIESFIKIRVKKEQQALDLVARGRCDLFISVYEPINYGAKVGIYQLDPELDFIGVPGQKQEFYLGVGKSNPRAEQLFKALNSTLNSMQKRGAIQHILNHHLN